MALLERVAPRECPLRGTTVVCSLENIMQTAAIKYIEGIKSMLNNLSIYLIYRKTMLWYDYRI